MNEQEDPADFINAWFNALEADLGFELRGIWNHKIQQSFKCSVKCKIPPIDEPGTFFNVLIANLLEEALERDLFENKVVPENHRNCDQQAVSDRKITVAPKHLIFGLERKYAGVKKCPQLCSIPEFLDLGRFCGELGSQFALLKMLLMIFFNR